MKFNFKPPKIDFKPGTVILAGSGPGSKDLITLKVYIAIKLADVIIYDALVNKNLLKNSKKTSILIFAGKTKNTKACSQNEINQWMVYHAKKNKKILRLKGGDPSFFSRGSQEIDFLKKIQSILEYLLELHPLNKPLKVVITPFTMKVGYVTL